MLLFSCTFVFLFVCFFFFKKNLTIISLLTLYIVNKATIDLRVGITQRPNSKWPSCDVLILNFTILSSRRKNGISLLKFLEIKSILSPWGRVAVSNISLVPKSPAKITGVCGLKHFQKDFYRPWQQIFTVVTLILMENERDLSTFNSGNIGFSLLKHLISLSSGYRFSSVAAYQYWNSIFSTSLGQLTSLAPINKFVQSIQVFCQLKLFLHQI